ncbi:LacI family transcriptional regulator [Friedmanniella endophytica]|uniref:LacI family transcriptional regulator n=1 Tax=Microlunatus kandeliicorticis TaxID=1759536 RepID=A0A7W3INQ5_9ACTN|nr:LacI family DNA-binding transcriptional regulator [Microlunatus kandeliicorticis]MBA8792445.1 LacI family transcriptional regulator [Microlunatus kandeliicorticis]
MTTTGRPVRITDVAALAGVSPGTVSKALNNTGALRDSTRARVREAADRLGFVPDPDARWLSARRSYTVGLLSADSAGRFSIPVMLGAESALAAGRMAALLATSRRDPVREVFLVESMLARRVDGLIVTGRTTDPRPPVDLGGSDIPVVYAFSPSTDPDDASVFPDDAHGARLVVEHLLATGRRRIVHVGGRPHQHSSTERAEAAQRALADAGLGLAAPTLFGEWSEAWGRQAVDVLLRTRDLADPDADLGFDAIMCGSDQIARGACDRLRELGVAVPERVAVTGFDDWDVMALASRPPLTTVDLRLEELGRRAAELLLDAIAGRPHHGRELMPMRLVPRASTG